MGSNRNLHHGQNESGRNKRQGRLSGLSPNCLLAKEVTLNYAMPEDCAGGNKQARYGFLSREVTEPFTTPTKPIVQQVAPDYKR
jgi:hypothetical protein